MRVHLLCSGGLDSTTLAFHYRSLGHELSIHWVDYHQASRNSEWQAVKWVASTVGAARHGHEVTGLHAQPGEIPGRNRTLIEAILPHIEGPALVALGIHAGCGYEDTQPPFRDAMQRALDGRFRGLVRMDCPFLHMTKAEVAEAAVALGVPIEQTYSCDGVGPDACLSCRSCREREQALLGRDVALLA